MFPTVIRCSKASRRPLTPKRGNKDYYKGTRQAFLPGGHRTGAPGKHVIGGKAKYRLVDEKVRVFVAPPIAEIESSPLKPYVARGVQLDKKERLGVLGKLPSGGVQGTLLLDLARKHMTKPMAGGPQFKELDVLEEASQVPATTQVQEVKQPQEVIKA